jgi:hypothetical protein
MFTIYLTLLDEEQEIDLTRVCVGMRRVGHGEKGFEDFPLPLALPSFPATMVLCSLLLARELRVFRRRLPMEARFASASSAGGLGHTRLAAKRRSTGAPAGFNFMQLETYNTAFDDYYLWGLGQRTIPAARPGQRLPSELRHLLNELLRIDGCGCSLPGEMLLDLEFHERDRLATLIQQFAAGARSSNRSSIKFTTRKALIVIRVGKTVSPSLQSEARLLAREKEKSTIIFELNDSGQLLAWGVAENPKFKSPE